jgi:hypothetical protein
MAFPTATSPDLSIECPLRALTARMDLWHIVIIYMKCVTHPSTILILSIALCFISYATIRRLESVSAFRWNLLLLAQQLELVCFRTPTYRAHSYHKKRNTLLDRQRTIPTEWPPLVGEASANLRVKECGVVSETGPNGR